MVVGLRGPTIDRFKEVHHGDTENTEKKFRVFFLFVLSVFSVSPW
jgi:hypothetical protein